MLLAFGTVMAQLLAAFALAWTEFRRSAVARQGTGVLGLDDVAFVLVAVAVVPVVYLTLPLAVVVGLLGIAYLNVLAILFRSVVCRSSTAWIGATVVVSGVILAHQIFGELSAPAYLMNDVTVIMVAIGIANIWAQSGLKARDAAIMGIGFGLYDGLASWAFPVMADLVERLGRLPLAPLVRWPVDGDNYAWLGIGLGDLLLALVFPLVVRKAFGRCAGLISAGLGFSALAILLAMPVLGITDLARPFPVMVPLGAFMLAQYAWWYRRRGRERTTREFRLSEPVLVRNWRCRAQS